MKSLKQVFALLILLTGTLFAQTNLTFPNGTNLSNAKFVSGQARVMVTGNADLYTVPTNRRALFVGLQVYNDSPNALTSIVEAKIGGVYYSIATYWTTTAPGATTAVNPTPPIILEAGQSLSINVNQQPVNVFPVILEFDNTANVFSKVLTSLAAGDNTIYTVPTGKSAMLLTVNLVPEAHNQVVGYWNSSGGTRTTKVNIVPNGGTPSNANLLGGAQTTANGAVSNNTLNFGLVSVTLNAGDSVSINVDNGTAIQFAWVTVVEMPTLASIAVSPQNTSVPKGSPQQFTASGTYSDGSTQDLTGSVTWVSSATNIATVNNSGLATTLAQGTTTISASLGSVSDSTMLTVTAPTLVSVAVTPTNPMVIQGLNQQFSATGTYTDGSTQNLTATATWASSSPNVATINSSGLVTTVAQGVTTISASLGSVSGSTALTVVVPAITGLSPTLGPVNTYVIISGSNFGTIPGTVTFNGVNAAIVNWVDATITSLVPQGASSGPVVVTAQGMSSNSMQFSVTLGIAKLVPPLGIAGTTSVTILGSGFGSSGTATFNGVVANPSSWSDSSITVQVPSAATTGPVIVNVSGVNSNGIYFTVQPPPSGLSSIVISPATATMVVGEDKQVTLKDNNGNRVTEAQWSVSDNTLLSLSTDNPPVLTALAPGAVTLTANYFGFTANATITIMTGPLAMGTVLWSAPSGSSGAVQLLHVDNAGDGQPAIYAFNQSSTLSAFTDDGQQLWTVTQNIPALRRVAVDNNGGVLTSDSFSVIERRDSATGLMMWRYDNSPAYLGTENVANFATGGGGFQPAIHPDGTIYHQELQPPVQDSGFPNSVSHQYWDIVALNPITGQPRLTIPMPTSNRTENNPGCPPNTPPSTSNATIPAGFGNLTIGPDGSIYIETDVINIVTSYPQGACSTSHTVRDDTLSLYTIRPNGSYTSQPLTTYHYEWNGLPLQYPRVYLGYVVPNNNGGVMAYWNYYNPIDGTSGSVVWNQSAGSFPSPFKWQNSWIAGAGSTIYGVGGSGWSNAGLDGSSTLTAYDGNTGTTQWASTSSGGFQPYMAVADGLFTTTGTGLLKFDTSGNQTPYNFGNSSTYASPGRWNFSDVVGNVNLVVGPDACQGVSAWQFYGGNQSGQRDGKPSACITVNFGPGSKSPDDHLLYGTHTQTCSENLGILDCATKQTWVWNLEVEARVSDDASNWVPVNSYTGLAKGFMKDSSGSLQTFREPENVPNDSPDSRFVQQPAGQKLIFWIDAPGHGYEECGLLFCHTIDSMTQVQNFISEVCSTQNFQLANSSCFKVKWYLKLLVNPGAQLDFIHSQAALGATSTRF